MACVALAMANTPGPNCTSTNRLLQCTQQVSQIIDVSAIRYAFEAGGLHLQWTLVECSAVKTAANAKYILIGATFASNTSRRVGFVLFEREAPQHHQEMRAATVKWLHLGFKTAKRTFWVNEKEEAENNCTAGLQWNGICEIHTNWQRLAAIEMAQSASRTLVTLELGLGGAYERCKTY